MAMSDAYRAKQKAALAAARAATQKVEVVQQVVKAEQNQVLAALKKYYLTSEVFAEEVKALVRKERSKREVASRVR